MKLQGNQRAAMTSLGRNNSSLTGINPQATKEATQGVANILTTAADTTAKLNTIRTDRERQQSNLYMQKSTAEFYDQWGGKEFFDVSELPDDIVTEGMQVKGRIASAEVLPMMYEDFIARELPNAAKIIETESARNEWTSLAKETSLVQQQKIQTSANAQIERQIFADQKINYKNAIEQRRPDVALQIASEMNGSPTETKEFKRVARETAETIQYENQMIQEDVPEMVKSLEYLRKEAADYEKSNGQLDDTGRLTWIGKLENEIGRLTKVDESKNKAAIELLRREAKLTTSNSNKGKQTDLATLSNLRRRMVAENEDGSMSAEIADLDAAAIHSYNVNNMNKGSKESRDSYIKQYESNNGANDFETQEALRKLEIASDSQTVAENTDMLKSAVDSGYIRALAPVSVESGNPNLIAGQLKVRKLQHDQAEANFGVSQGYLTQDEVKKLSSQFNGKTPRQQIDFLRATSATLGADSINLYSQMQTDGNGGSLAIAGNVALNGTEANAETILAGNEFRRNSGENLKDINEFIGLKVQENIGAAFYSNANYNKNVKDAVVDAYIGLVLQSGGSKEDLKVLDTGGMFDEGLYQQAENMVTGGILTQNNNLVPPPVYGMKQSEMDTWIKEIAPEEIVDMGGTGSSGPEEFLKQLRNEDLTLVGSSRQGEYTVRDSKGQTIANDDGSVFVFKYKEGYKHDLKKRMKLPSFIPGVE